MSITITAEGVDAAMARMREALEAVGEQKARAALARAINRTLTAVRAEAVRSARTTYTARQKKLFERVSLRRAGRSNLEASKRAGTNSRNDRFPIKFGSRHLALDFPGQTLLNSQFSNGPINQVTESLVFFKRLLV